MHIYGQIYEFASSAGAFEGYVYNKKSVNDIDMEALDVWSGHLAEAYALLPEEVIGKFQDRLDLTLNRALASLNLILEKNHPIAVRLMSMIRHRTDGSPDDFQKTKWFEPS